MSKFIEEADEDLMHMDSQADEAFILANTYQEYEQKKQLEFKQLMENEAKSMVNSKSSKRQSEIQVNTQKGALSDDDGQDEGDDPLSMVF